MERLPNHDAFERERLQPGIAFGYRQRVAQVIRFLWDKLSLAFARIDGHDVQLSQLRKRLLILESRSPFTGFRIRSEPLEGNMKKLTVLPVFADGTSVIDDAHQLPAGVLYPSGVHFADVEVGEIAVDPETPNVATFTPDDPNTAGDVVNVTVDGFTGVIPPFTFQPPVALTGFKVVAENVTP